MRSTDAAAPCGTAPARPAPSAGHRPHPPGPWLAVGLLVASLAGCSSAKVGGPAGGGSSGAGAGGGAAGGRGGQGGINPDAPFFEVYTPEAGASEAASEAPTCGEDTVKAQRTPVDLLLLIDASDSMAALGAGTTRNKYDLVSDALLRFARDPASAGLGLGLQFFPLPGPGSSCDNDADCGYLSSPTTPACQQVTACADSIAAGRAQSCRRDGTCASGACVPLGRCARSLADCANLGQPCPGGGADDTCRAVGKVCGVVTDILGCSVSDYAAPFVPITELPSPAERLVSWGLDVRYPSGGTPLRPAVEGALNHLREHLATRPGRRGVLVLASDGAPSPGCASNTVAATAGLITAARTGANPVDTYVVGVYTATAAGERAALEQLATAGGTSAPLVIMPNEDLDMRFQQALNQIRGQALPCELLIPPPRPGAGALDLGKVNLRFTGASGEELVPYTATADRCDAQRGGWYYDIDPAGGATPTRILVCPATCQRWKSDPNATVDLRIGCKTRVID